MKVEVPASLPARRPTKRTPQTAKIICDCVAQGMALKHACAVAGLSFVTFSEWRSEDESFCTALERAVADGVRLRLEVIEEATRSTDKALALRAACWWLEHVAPDFYARNRIEVEAVGQFHHSFVIPQATLDQIAQARAKREREVSGAQAPQVTEESSGTISRARGGAGMEVHEKAPEPPARKEQA